MQVFSFTRDNVHVTAQLPFGWTEVQDDSLLYVTRHYDRGWDYVATYIMVEDSPTARIVVGTYRSEEYAPVVMVSIHWSQLALHSELHTAIQIVERHIGGDVAQVLAEHIGECEAYGYKSNVVHEATFAYMDVCSICTDYSDMCDLFWNNIPCPDFDYNIED